MSGKLPVTIFTGFLGTGKTTILKSLIMSEPDKRFAVVINEFGKVSVDDLLVMQVRQSDNFQVYKLSGGLIAYEDNGFLDTMLQIADNAAGFDHVLIETSGLAAPTAVMESLAAPRLAEHFTLDATLSLVDTPLFLDYGKLSQETLTVMGFQMKAADVVVLNKIDKLERRQLEEAEAKVRDLAPDVRFIELAFQARLVSRLSLGLKLNEFRAGEYIAGITNFAGLMHQAGAASQNGHSHSGLGAHDHGLHTHEHLHQEDPGWLSFSLTSHKKQRRNNLETALETIAAEMPLLRVKGFVQCLEIDEPVLFQGVNTRIESSVGESAGIEPEAMAVAHVHSHSHSHSHDHDHHHHEHEHEHTHHHDHDQNHAHDHHHHEHEHEHTPNSNLVFIGYHLDRLRLGARLNELTAAGWH
ncbi:MAG: GTP-binding protein [Candidatus Melainabacteria bacterium]|nr:GTP-binding protein [Candidatus Melainabacteria bacterium]